MSLFDSQYRNNLNKFNSLVCFPRQGEQPTVELPNHIYTDIVPPEQQAFHSNEQIHFIM